MELCSLRTMCLEWSATDFAFVIHHTRTVPKQTKDNTILLGLRDVTLALSWLFWLLELAPYKCSTYLLTYRPAVAWRWFGGDTRSRLRDVACRLLQCNSRHGSEDNNRQATTSVKHCCTSRQRHQKVWSGTITTDAPGVTLALADIHERVNYKLGVMIHKCLLGKTPMYLSNCCIPVSQVATRRHIYAPLHVISWPYLDIVSALSRRAFAVAGKTINDLRDPAVSTSTFGHLFSAY